MPLFLWRYGLRAKEALRLPHHEFLLYLEGLDQIDAIEALGTYRGASLVMGGDGAQSRLDNLSEIAGIMPKSVQQSKSSGSNMDKWERGMQRAAAFFAA